MNPVSFSIFPLPSFHKQQMDQAFIYLQERPYMLPTLSEREFTALAPDARLATVFQHVFGRAFSKDYSYDQFKVDCKARDQALEQKLEEWGREEGNAAAKEKIAAFLQDGKETKLYLNDLHLNDLPDIWDHSAFVTRLQKFNLIRNRLQRLPPSFVHLSSLQDLVLAENRLQTLPSDFGLLSSLRFLNLWKNDLSELPESLGMLTSLQNLCINENQLQHLPQSLTKLVSLEGLYAGKNRLQAILPMNHSPHLKEMIFSSNQNLTSLPEEIFQMPSTCRIGIEVCGFSVRVLQELQQRVNAPGYLGPRFVFSIPERSSSSIKSLQELVQELSQVAKQSPMVLSQELSESLSLRDWLSRLSTMADYLSGGEARVKLAKTVLDILQTVSRDSLFKEVFLSVIKEATKSCGDRMALSLLHLGIQHAIATASKEDFKKIATLLTRGSIVLDALEKIARNKIETMSMVDPIEVYLAYPIQLQQELKIPLAVQGMRYFSGLKEEDFSKAKQEVERLLSDKERIYQDLITRDLWIDTLKEYDRSKVLALEEQRASAWEASEDPSHTFQEGLLELTRKALTDWEP